MPWTRVTRFDREPLHAISLHLWAVGRTNGKHLIAEARGPFRVHCHAGVEHTVTVMFRADAWRDGAGHLADNIRAAYDGDLDAARSLATDLVDAHLAQGWSCDCQTRAGDLRPAVPRPRTPPAAETL